MEEPVKVEVEQLQALLLGVSNYLPVVLARTYFEHGECNFLFKSLLDVIILIEVYFEVPGYANRIVKESAGLLLSLTENVEEPSVTIEELEGGNRNRRLSATTAMTRAPPTLTLTSEQLEELQKLQFENMKLNLQLQKESLEVNAKSFIAHATLGVEERKLKIEKLKGTNLQKFTYSFLLSVIIVLFFGHNINIAGGIIVGIPSVILGSGVVALELASEKVAETAFKVGSASYDATVGKAVNAVDNFKTTVSDVASRIVDAPTKFINYASSVSDYLFSKTVTAPVTAATATATADTAATAVLTNTTDLTEIINNATQIIQNRTFRDRLSFRSTDIQHVIHELFKELITNHISTEDKYIATVLLILLLTFLFFGIAWSIEKWAIAKSGVASAIATEPSVEVVDSQREQIREVHNIFNQQNNLIIDNPIPDITQRRRQPRITNGGSIKRRVTYRKKRFNRKTVKR
jgi:hypothetical protein